MHHVPMPNPITCSKTPLKANRDYNFSRYHPSKSIRNTMEEEKDEFQIMKYS